VERALQQREPLVAPESAVITHGLPYPQSLDVALGMQQEIIAAGAVPATIAVLDGEIRVGLTEDELRRLAQSKENLKIGVRDLVGAHLQRASGGTTVAATMYAARLVGIQVFATGGIGGVHRESSFDVSADLQALAHTRMVVVCAGAKAILDLAATLEMLESLSVPVLGYGTDEFPAFYSRESGLRTSPRADSAVEVAQYWASHCALGLASAFWWQTPSQRGGRNRSGQSGNVDAASFCREPCRRHSRQGTDPVPAPQNRRTQQRTHT
jgi:pseudouridine-5'-phosphate glycosidase